MDLNQIDPLILKEAIREGVAEAFNDVYIFTAIRDGMTNSMPMPDKILRAIEDGIVEAARLGLIKR